MPRTTRWILALLALPAVTLAQDKKKEINVDFLVGWDGCYRPLEWTPIVIGVTTPFKDPLDCRLTLTVAQDRINNLCIERQEVFMPARTHEITLMTKLAFPADKCTLTMRGTQSMFYWSRDYELWSRPWSSSSRVLTAVDRCDLLIGVSGRQGFGIMQLPRRSACQYRGLQDGGETGSVHVKYRFQRLLPPDWTGYASLDLLVLYDVDWDQLTPHQSKGIAQWVQNGGRVLVVLGKNPLPEAHPIARLLPFKIAPAREVTVPAAVLRDWGVRGNTTGRLACWSIEAAESAPLWQVRREGPSLALLAFGPAGFGKAGVLAADPFALGGEQDGDLAGFWIAQISCLLQSRQITASDRPQSESDNRWHFRLDRPDEAANTILEHLLSLEELRPLHIGWVVLALVLLALLIGPVDYLVLRSLGRLPLTWVTTSACIALFTAAAYYGVEYLRGGTLRVRAVTVLDGVEGGPSWRTQYCGIFAPRSDDYCLEGLDRRQWWAGILPTAGDDLYAYQTNLGTRNIYCAQHVDGGNLPVSVPVNIWSMQCLLGESPADGMPLRAKVRRDGDEWVVSVQNAGPADIKAGRAVVQQQSVALGPVPAGQTREFRAAAERRRDRPARQASRSGGEPEVPAQDELERMTYQAKGCWPRTEGILSYAEQGATVICVELDRPPTGFSIARRQAQFEHRQFARLVVMPEGNTP